MNALVWSGTRCLVDIPCMKPSTAFASAMVSRSYHPDFFMMRKSHLLVLRSCSQYTDRQSGSALRATLGDCCW